MYQIVDSSMHKPCVWSPVLHKPSVVFTFHSDDLLNKTKHAYNPSICEAVQGHFWPHSKFEANLNPASKPWTLRFPIQSFMVLYACNPSYLGGWGRRVSHKFQVRLCNIVKPSLKKGLEQWLRGKELLLLFQTNRVSFSALRW